MKSKILFLPIILAAMPGWVLSAPTGTGSPQAPAVDSACLNHDFTQMQALLRTAQQAIDKGDRALFDKTAAAIRQCMVFEVTFRSTLVTTAADRVSTITGTGSATLALGPDMEEAGYEFTAGPQGAVVPLVWSNVTMTSKDCTFDITPSPPTPYNFWLALDTGKKAAGTVEVAAEGAEEMAGDMSPTGGENHIVVAECKRQTGLPMLDKLKFGKKKSADTGLPTRMIIFGDAWTALYGGIDDPPIMGGGSPAEGLKGITGMLGRMSQLGTDPDAAAEKLENDPDMLDEEMQQIGADDATLDKMQNNFRMELEALPVGGAVFGRYTANRTKPLPGGQGTVQEDTEIVVTHKSGAAANR
ncbi:MAG: hypothetical protein L6Q83_11770 [Gammaproteobacteria bacterium]|nr:hypothetical protein [Gammaproteobacteria bacterium]